jgi:hypothetical protein
MAGSSAAVSTGTKSGLAVSSTWAIPSAAPSGPSMLTTLVSDGTGSVISASLARPAALVTSAFTPSVAQAVADGIHTEQGRERQGDGPELVHRHMNHRHRRALRQQHRHPIPRPMPRARRAFASRFEASRRRRR